ACATRQGEPAHRTDRGQRLAAEAEAPDAQQIVLGQLRGAMALDRERQLVAPASMAFSTSSLTAEAGRSTTSPAAMRLTRTGGNWRMAMAYCALARAPPPAAARVAGLRQIGRAHV